MTSIIQNNNMSVLPNNNSTEALADTSVEEKTMSQYSSKQSFEFNDMSLLPVKCFCGKIIGGMETPYKTYLKRGLTPKDALDKLGLSRSCCRTNVQNPPQIPLALQVNGDETKIRELYKEFNITKENVAAYTSNNNQPAYVNLSGNKNYNPQPLNAGNRPKRIYELTKRSKGKVALLDNHAAATVESVTEIAAGIDNLNLSLE
jgi:DNA-directed RNA polymerase subunit N (RpoN/RPB10)